MRIVSIKVKARRDMSRISDFIADSVSLRSAERWYDQIQSVAMSLADDAELWPEAEEAEQFGIDLRFRAFGKRRHVYRILYTFDDESVTIHRVLHAAQDWLAELE